MLHCFQKCQTYPKAVANAPALAQDDEWQGHYKYTSKDGLNDAGPTLWISAMFVGLYAASTSMSQSIIEIYFCSYLMSSPSLGSGPLVATMVSSPYHRSRWLWRDFGMGRARVERQKSNIRHAVSYSDIDDYHLVRSLTQSLVSRFYQH